MTVQGWSQIVLFLAVLAFVAIPLGWYMARVFSGQRVFLSPVIGPVERVVYKLIRVDVAKEQDWKRYGRDLVLFSLIGWIALYVILRTQHVHPFNPQGFHSAPWNVSFNTVSSFLTNTNWQYYGGETTMTYWSQMFGLAVQNFLSAAVGIAVVVALIRGIVVRSGNSLGNFWQDLTRAVLFVLLPIAIVGGIVLMSQGVIQTVGHYTTMTSPTGVTQQIALGPVASQEVIKELGTNGGGFFNTNSAMPFENPTPFSNFFEMLLVLIIPVGLVAAYGRMVGSRRQALAIGAAMTVLFIGAIAVAYAAEQHGSPAQHAAGLHTAPIANSTGGNLEGKEQRFGIANSALFDVITTVTSCGAVNSAIESYTALGGAVPMANLSLSETVFGGVGTGLYSMLVFVILSVFIGGLMVGRTPEYLGKKIEAHEIKLASIAVLLTPLAVLIASAVATAAPAGRKSISAAATGPQGFSETFYAYLSQANNNGSAFAGYSGFIQPNAGNLGSHGITFANLAGGLTMVFARYGPILAVLALAGSLAGKKVSPAGLGTMRTDNPTFVVLLLGVLILVGALTFFPALLLGPIVQSLTARLF